MKRSHLIIFLIIISIGLAGCSAAAVTIADTPVVAGLSLEQETIIISAIGDIMMHNTQLQAGYQPDTNTYDFSSFFRFVKPLLTSSDLVIGNLETTLAGKAAGYSGYPRFNSPDVLASNLKEAGFDVLTTANNHCYDKGYDGLAATLDRLDEAGLLHAGTARSQAEQDKPLIVDVKGIKFAILSYTYSTNGLNPPKNRTYAVNYLDEQRIITDAKKARDNGAQLVIAALHFGIEYQTRPNAEQMRLAESLLNTGADIVLGYHPHVLQPAFLIDNKFVIYSLGNFVSDQTGLERKASIILNLQFAIDPQTMQPYFQAASYIPIWTHRYLQNGKAQFAVLPVEPALTSIGMGQKGSISNTDAASLQQAWQYITNHLESDSSKIKLHNISIPLVGLDLIKKLSY
jgi:poly-gamma-glutamate synthesis protein (capsule biosynthesis protein)